MMIWHENEKMRRRRLHDDNTRIQERERDITTRLRGL
jgi:hypothetical protein